MKNIMVITAAFLAVTVVMTGTGAANQLIYYLNNSNVVQINNNVSVKVIVNNGKPSGTPSISVQLVSSTVDPVIVGKPLGIDIFYYNLKNPIVPPVNDLNGTWNFLNQGSTQASAFGDLLSKQSKAPAGRGGIFQPIIFKLTNKFNFVSSTQAIPYNDATHKATIVVHIRFANGCTGFVSDGLPTPSSVSSCVTPVPIPEFPTIALPVAAVIALMFFFHIRRKKEEKEE